jgi:hypothetical protein
MAGLVLPEAWQSDVRTIELPAAQDIFATGLRGAQIDSNQRLI